MLLNLSQVSFKWAIYTITSPYSPLCSLYVFLVADNKNLFNNQELLKLVIIFFILVALTFNSEVKLYREIIFFFHSLDGFTYHVRIIKTKSKVYLQKCMCYYKSKPEQAKCPWNHGELNVT